ncbi:MAG TPA: hypothetical protein VMZ92_12215 [Planctomycetota bacterium]|nr:hypothetical protein [Planctomycetota bacterium]
MKRLLLVVMVVLGLSLSASGAPLGRRPAGPVKVSPPEVLREIKPAELTVGMRVRVQCHRGRALVGTVSRITDEMVQLDLSAEETGLPGRLKLRTADLSQLYELKKQTDEEKEAVLEAHRQRILAIKASVQERLEKRQAEETEAAESAEAAEEDLRKALDVVVAGDEEERMRALVDEFPPDKWGEAKLREIRENWILQDLPPNAKESRFVSVFEEWKEARDVVAALDARKEEARGRTLLVRFPPSEGWGEDRLAGIIEKQAKGEAVSEEEAEFKTSYEVWSKALRGRAAEIEAQPPAEETPPVETAEPVETGKPAEETPPAETAKPAEKTDTPAEEKAPAETK